MRVEPPPAAPRVRAGAPWLLASSNEPLPPRGAESCSAHGRRSPGERLDSRRKTFRMRDYALSRQGGRRDPGFRAIQRRAFAEERAPGRGGQDLAADAESPARRARPLGCRRRRAVRPDPARLEAAQRAWRAGWRRRRPVRARGDGRRDEGRAAIDGQGLAVGRAGASSSPRGRAESRSVPSRRALSARTPLPGRSARPTPRGKPTSVLEEALAARDARRRTIRIFLIGPRRATLLARAAEIGALPPRFAFPLRAALAVKGQPRRAGAPTTRASLVAYRAERSARWCSARAAGAVLVARQPDSCHRDRGTRSPYGSRQSLDPLSPRRLESARRWPVGGS